MTDDLIKHAKKGAIGRKDHVRAVGYDITIDITIPSEIFQRAQTLAHRRAQDPADMITAIITHAIQDDMVEAIIDDGRGR